MWEEPFAAPSPRRVEKEPLTAQKVTKETDRKTNRGGGVTASSWVSGMEGGRNFVSEKAGTWNSDCPTNALKGVLALHTAKGYF